MQLSTLTQPPFTLNDYGLHFTHPLKNRIAITLTKQTYKNILKWNLKIVFMNNTQRQSDVREGCEKSYGYTVYIFIAFLKVQIMPIFVLYAELLYNRV